MWGLEHERDVDDADAYETVGAERRTTVPASYFVPSTSAIDGIVKLSQLGAPLGSVSSEFLTLIALAILYNLAAVRSRSIRWHSAIALN